MDLSEPTLVPRQESERYLLAVAHFARKISREKQLMRQRERNLVLRFSTAPSYLSRKYHPYKRILDNERGDIGLEGQPNAAELNRFLDAIAALERPEVAQAQVAPRQHQPWYVHVADFVRGIPLRIRNTAIMRRLFPPAENQ